jgi:hypothetical protein
METAACIARTACRDWHGQGRLSDPYGRDVSGYRLGRYGERPQCCCRSSRKALEADPLHIENNRMICGYAEDMQKWFADGEIDVIHLNFSDPWPKKHAHKKRLSSAKFLAMYRSSAE